MKNNGIDVVVIAYIVSQFKLIIDIINKWLIGQKVCVKTLITLVNI